MFTFFYVSAELDIHNFLQNSQPTVEATKKPEVNSTPGTVNVTHESIQPTTNESTDLMSSDLINLAESADNSSTSNPGPTDVNAQVASYFDQGLDFNISEKLPEAAKTLEVTQDDGIVKQSIENDSQVVNQYFPPPPAPSIVNFSPSKSDNGTRNDSPFSQKDNLLQMASAVADALHENSDSTGASQLDTDLEYRNQFLSSCLQEQKQLVSQLHVQVSQYSSRVSELEAILATKDAEFEAKLARELNPLREQLQVHAQTTGILVGERAELSAAIEQCQSIAQRKSVEVEELTGKLKASQLRVTELEKELAHVKNTVEETRKMSQQLQFDYAELERKHDELRKAKEDDELEASELRQELSMKNAEATNLQRELDEKNTLLSLNDLKIQQLTTNPQEMQALESQHQAAIVLEQQLSQLREALKSVSHDKEEAAKQYENYVRQLDERYEKIIKDVEESRKKVEILEDRERSYIQRLSDLEQSLQRERETVAKLRAVESHEEQIEHLTKSLDALSLEHSSLQTTLNERDTEIESLKRDLEEMREMNEDSVEKSKLVSALESEQLGASRAVSQNQQLKAQLNEMHDAFVTLSNSKLDLTEQLQAERTIGRKLNAQLNKMETEVDDLKEQLKMKDATLAEMESEKLQTAQIADQMHHYQAQSQQARTLQQELQNALGCIEILRRENQQLSVQFNALRQESSGDKNLSNGDERLKEEVDNARSLSESAYTSMKAYSAAVDPVPDPLRKLEVRFRETMDRVAELTDEKQRLEHLVLQLQGETETIGEYITLYQKQRAILQRKAQEKEETFRLLLEQRNHQQEQLHKLKVLVADLIKQKSSTASLPPDPQSPPIIEFENEGKDEDHTHDHTEQNREKPEEPVADDNDNTTAKILDLLTEIKDCKDTCTLEPNFHPCPWCSGKLITV